MRYRLRRRPRVAILLPLAIVGTIVMALTAANVVPVSHADDLAQAITANTLKPTECNGITLTTLVIGAGNNVNGSGANELILGTAANNTVRGNGGTDCILGGGGNDDIRGGTGADVCIGGPGTDTFTSCATSYP